MALITFCCFSTTLSHDFTVLSAARWFIGAVEWECFYSLRGFSLGLKSLFLCSAVKYVALRLNLIFIQYIEAIFSVVFRIWWLMHWNLCCTCRRWACSLWWTCSSAPERTSGRSQTSSRRCRGGRRSRRRTWLSRARPPSGRASRSPIWRSVKTAELCHIFHIFKKHYTYFVLEHNFAA